MNPERQPPDDVLFPAVARAVAAHGPGFALGPLLAGAGLHWQSFARIYGRRGVAVREALAQASDDHAQAHQAARTPAEAVRAAAADHDGYPAAAFLPGLLTTDAFGPVPHDDMYYEHGRTDPRVPSRAWAASVRAALRALAADDPGAADASALAAVGAVLLDRAVGPGHTEAAAAAAERPATHRV